MSAQTEMLGGRLPLLDPSTLSAAQKETYEHLNKTWVPWANGVPFQSKLEDGRLIGPFNPILFSPAISSSFSASTKMLASLTSQLTDKTQSIAWRWSQARTAA
jgi:4-carboxymuconolactone decarboxylase